MKETKMIVTFKNVDEITMHEVFRLNEILQTNMWEFLIQCPNGTVLETENTIFTCTEDCVECKSKKRKAAFLVRYKELNAMAH